MLRASHGGESIKSRALASVFALLVLGLAGPATGQGTTPSPPGAPATTAEAPAATAAAPAPVGSPIAPPAAAAPFDPRAATRAYLDRVPPDQKARSDAYFEGGYWLQLWGFLYGLAVALLLLSTGLSRRLRDFAA